MSGPARSPLALAPNAAIYAAYFAALGLWLPFLPAYLGRIGLSGFEIGVVMAITPIMLSVAPLAWGFIADRTRRGAVLLRVVAGAAAGVMALLASANSFISVAATMLVYSIFSAPIAPLNDAATLLEVRRNGGDYNRVRTFGSLGFVLGSFGVGLWEEAVPDLGPEVFSAAALCLAAVLSVTFLVRSEGVTLAPARLSDVQAILRDRRLVLLLSCCALHWLALAPFHSFFPVYVADLDMPPFVSGGGMALGAFAEVLVMWSFTRIARARSPSGMLAFAFFASAARWLLTAVARDPVALLAIQALHGFSFGIFYAAALRAMVNIVPDELRATGQGLFFSIVFGLGGGLGTLATGASYDEWGGSVMFAAAGVVALIPAFLIRRLR